MSFQLQRKVHRQQQLKELKEHSWSTPNYRSGHLRNYPGHRVSLGKSFINFCVMSLHDDDDTHIAKWVVVLLATPHAGFDVNFITLPEISCTHITHITHYPSELREHIVQRVLGESDIESIGQTGQSQNGCSKYIEFIAAADKFELIKSLENS